MAKGSVWLEYNWDLDGEAALFGVELSYYRTAPDASHPLLLYFCCQRTDGKPLEPADVRRAEAVASRCARRIKCAPAGFVQTDTLRQYYFYASGKDDHDILEKIGSGERKLVCRIGGKREDDWATYFQLLYPNEAKYQTIRNREQVEKLRSIGDNTEATRRINLHVCFRTEQARLLFEETARQAGFAIGSAEFNSDSELPNGVVIYRISSLKLKELDALTVRVMTLAQKYDGRLLYWDCNIVPKRSSKRI